MWIETNEPYVDEFRNDNARFRKFFVEKDTEWPLLSISIWYPWHDDLKGLLVLVNKKDNVDGWWYSSSLPIELSPELITMLKIVKNENFQKDLFSF